jgi:hypothetical protein
MLGPTERTVISAVLDALPPQDAQTLRDQVETAHVVGGMPRLIDLAVDPSAAAANYPDGPLPATATVTGADGELTGEILVWVTDGRLSGLEYAWYTDQPPVDWPSLDRVRVTFAAEPLAGTQDAGSSN